MLMAAALVLAACGSESKEDVIDSIEEKADEVEKYYMETTLDVTGFDADDNVVDESTGELHVYIDESTGESSGEMIQDSQIIEYYSTNEATYAQMDDSGWEDMAGAEEQFDQSDTEYGDVAQIIIDLKDDEDFEMEAEDDTFTFTFEGKSEDVYNALENPYSLTFTGLDVEDIEQELTITVDSETYHIEHLQAKLVAEKDGEKLEMNIDHVYEQINDIDDISIPEDVVTAVEEADEANDDIFGDDGEEESNEEEEEDETAADDGEEKTRTFRAEEPGIQATITYYYQGDNVTKQTTENVIDYEAVGLESKDEAKEMFDPESEQFQGVDGVTHEMIYEDDQATELLEVDYENLDFDEAGNLPGMMFEEGAEEYGISMEQSADMLLEQGFEEIE